jgi:hypothetical protein
MNLYIQLENGQPINHPIIEDNLVQAFPDIDLDNLPSNFARFERVAADITGIYNVYEGVSYEWVDGIVKDVHRLRAMTPEERAEKQNMIKDSWAESGNATNWPSWTFDEELCRYVPPVPYPEFETGRFRWDEPSLNWVEITE